MKADLLKIDCTAALVVGVAVLALHPWLAQLFALPVELVFVMGVVNLVYGFYSASLAHSPRRRTLRRVSTLALANLAWVPVCFGAAAYFYDQASPLGLAQLIGEGFFVGTLGALEWRARERLAQAPS